MPNTLIFKSIVLDPDYCLRVFYIRLSPQGEQSILIQWDGLMILIWVCSKELVSTHNFNCDKNFKFE